MAAVMEFMAARLRRSSGKNFSGSEIFGVLGFRGAQLILSPTNRVDGISASRLLVTCIGLFMALAAPQNLKLW